MTAQASSIFRDGLFADRVVVVSGGGTGIGRTTARELGRLGATVVICGRRAEPLEATREALEAEGIRVKALPCNIRDPEAVSGLFASVVDEFGRVDGLVNNAGGQFLSPAAAITPKGWHAVVETNLTGTFLMCQAAFTQSMRVHGGAIVNVVLDFWRGFPLMAHSSAARAGVSNLTKTLAVEWSPHAVRVNSVAPGLIDSSGLENYPEAVRQSFAAVAENDVPAARMGTEGEISAAIVFLLSPGASFISGTTLAVDGAGSLYRLQGFSLPARRRWPSGM